MKATNFIGMKVLSQEASEIGKIADLAMNLKECLVDKIIIVEGGALNKKYFAVTEDDLGEIGDYVQLKLGKEELESIEKMDKIESLMENEFHYKDLIGKTVVSKDAMELGKIENLIIDPKGCLIHDILLSSGSAFKKKQLMISDSDIESIGEYVILKTNKKDLENK